MELLTIMSRIQSKSTHLSYEVSQLFTMVRSQLIKWAIPEEPRRVMLSEAKHDVGAVAQPRVAAFRALLPWVSDMARD